MGSVATGGCSSWIGQDPQEVSGNEPVVVEHQEPILKSFDDPSQNQIVEAEPEEYVCPFVLPPGKHLTVMMFGMTGAGKSSLGNLIACSNVFAAGDDTASMTNLDSVMRYEASDGSLLLLDTIGLGDTEIDQEKVVASIRDVALSAVNGIDVFLFVMRNVRITDDAIMRLIYVTEYLWGHECLLNLYIVVTCASRYLQSRKDADEWIQRQVEINWRFKHIYGIVGNNPNRFIFVDNPDPDSGEPGLVDRRNKSYEALMKLFVLHPRDVVPPFTHAMMKQAQDMTEKERKNLEVKEQEVQRLQKAIEDKFEKKPPAKTKSKAKKKALPAKKSSAEEKPPEAKKAQPKRTSSKGTGRMASKESSETPVFDKRLSSNESVSGVSDVSAVTDSVSKEKERKNLEETLSKAKDEKLAAQKAMQKKLDAIRKDKTFQAEATRQVEAATLAFNKKLPSEKSPAGLSQDDAAVATAKAKAGKRMMGMLGFKGKGSQSTAAEQQQQVAVAAVVKIEANIEQILDETLARVRKGMNCSPADMFKKLGGWEGSGAIQPIAFNNFIRKHVSEIKPHHVGAMWRRGDSNCDGQLDLQEFRLLFGERSSNKS